MAAGEWEVEEERKGQARRALRPSGDVVAAVVKGEATLAAVLRMGVGGTWAALPEAPPIFFLGSSGGQLSTAQEADSAGREEGRSSVACRGGRARACATGEGILVREDAPSWNPASPEKRNRCGGG